MSSTYSPSTEEWIERAISIHGDRFDYSLVNYVTSTTPVQIICKIHGPSPQTPSSHIHQKAGCSKCSGKWKLDTEEFVKRAQTIHGDFYDYSKTIYDGKDEAVTIICPEHDDFKVRAADHLRGVRCRKCAGTLLEMFGNCQRVLGKFGDFSGTFPDFPGRVHGNSGIFPGHFW